jgi:anti-sigma-K factor RskA
MTSHLEGVHSLAAAYALDGLDEAETREFEAHLEGCPSCRDEVDALRDSAASLALAVDGPAPPPALRSRILEQARSERPNVVPLRRRFAAPRVATGVAAVAACAALGLGLWAASLARSLDRERAALRAQASALQILGDPAARRVPVQGANGTLAVASSGNAALALASLDPAPRGKVYEVWVINGKPLRAGLMKGGSAASAVRLERPVPAGSTVAVTVERAGGVDSPTSKPLLTAQA